MPKIIKSEIEFLKPVWFVFPFLFITFMIMFVVSFDNQRGYWTEYQKKFQDLEKNTLEFYYREEFIFQREMMDFKVTLIPNEFFSLFEGFYSNLFARIGIKPLTVYRNLKIFNSGGGLNISFLAFCVFVVLYGLGFSTSKNFKSLSDTYGKKKIFRLLSLTKIAVSVTFFIFIIACGVIIGALFGINILHQPLVIFLLVSVLLIILSFSMGLLLSRINPIAASILAVILFLIFFIIPRLDHGKSETVEQQIHECELNYNLYLKTMDAAGAFKKKFGNNPGLEPLVLEKFVDEYIGQDLKKVFDYEAQSINMVEKEVKRFVIYESLSPLAFYFSLSAEMSNGDINKIALYRKAMNFKQKYIRWNLKRRILKSMNKKIEPLFARDSEENILYATPALPVSFVPGVLSIIFYIFVFFFFAYLFYLKAKEASA